MTWGTCLVFVCTVRTPRVVPTLKDTPHGREANAVVRFDSTTGGEARGVPGIDAAHGLHYVLVIVENT